MKSCELEMRANGHSWSDLTQMARDREGGKMFVHVSLVGFTDAFNTIRLYKRQGCVTDSTPVRESQE